MLGSPSPSVKLHDDLVIACVRHSEQSPIGFLCSDLTSTRNQLRIRCVGFVGSHIIILKYNYIYHFINLIIKCHSKDLID